MLNDQQIEQAARKLCEIRGVDFDALALRMMNGGPTVGQSAIQEIRAYLQVQEAVAFVTSPLERVDPKQWAQLEEYFRSKWRSREPMAEQMPCDCAPLANCLKCGGSGIIQGRVEPMQETEWCASCNHGHKIIKRGHITRMDKCETCPCPMRREFQG